MALAVEFSHDVVFSKILDDHAKVYPPDPPETEAVVAPVDHW